MMRISAIGATCCHTVVMQNWPRTLLRFAVVLGAAAIAQSITHTWWQFVIITAIVVPLQVLERRFLPIRAVESRIRRRHSAPRH